MLTRLFLLSNETPTDDKDFFLFVFTASFCSLLKARLSFCGKSWATKVTDLFYWLSLSVWGSILHMSPPMFPTSAGSLRGDQSAAGSRLLGRQRRRAPTRWWTICLRGPRNTEPYLWTAVGRGPESPANPGYAETQTSLLFPLFPCVASDFIPAVSSRDSGLLWWRLPVRCSARGGVGVCGRREAGLQQPAGCEYHVGIFINVLFPISEAHSSRLGL